MSSLPPLCIRLSYSKGSTLAVLSTAPPVPPKRNKIGRLCSPGVGQFRPSNWANQTGEISLYWRHPDLCRSSSGSGEQRPYRFWFGLHHKAVQPTDPPASALRGSVGQRADSVCAGGAYPSPIKIGGRSATADLPCMRPNPGLAAA